jgi:hypothetical protein
MESQNQRIPLLARTLNNRLDAWKDKARSSEQRELIDQLAQNPQQLHQKLMQYRVLQSYPTLGNALMGESFIRFQILKLPLEDLEIDESQLTDTILQITYQLNQQKPKDVDDLIKLVNKMSGLLCD